MASLGGQNWMSLGLLERKPQVDDSVEDAKLRTAQEAAAEISALAKFYGIGPLAFEALRDINLTIHANEFLR